MRFNRRKTIAWSIAVLAIALFLALAMAPAIALRTDFVRRVLNDEPERFRLSYASVSSPWPGRVVVHGLELRGSDPNVEWWFRMEEAEIRVSLLDLLGRRFHATSVRAQGLRFRLRQRVAKSGRTAAALAPLPPIPGFGAVPTKEGPPFFPPPKSPGHYWKVQIDDLIAPASEIWIDQYRYEGAARVAGGFFLWPRKSAWVRPAQIDFEGGRLALGDETIAAAFRARAEARIAPFDPSVTSGEKVYRYISGKATVSGEMPSVRFANFYLRSSPEPRLSGGKGKIGGNLSLDNGVGSLALTIAGRGARATYRKSVLAGDVVFRARLAPWTPAEAVGRIDGSEIDLADVTAAGSREGWWGKFSLGRGSLRSETGGLALESHVGIHCRDARPLYAMFQVALPKWATGLVKMEGLVASMEARLGPALVEVRRLEARGGNMEIVGHYRKKGNSADGAFLVSSGPLSVGIDVGGGKSSLKLVGATKWYAARAPGSGR